MVDELIAPAAGSSEEDDDAKIWADLQKSEQDGPPENKDAVKPAPNETPETPETPDAPEKPEAPETPETTAPDKKDEDPWATAPENLRTEHEDLRKRHDAAVERERRTAGSFPAQNRKINELLADNKRLRKSEEDRKAALDKDSPANPELVQAREDYPEVVGPLEKELESTRAEITEVKDNVDRRFADIDSKTQANYVTDQAALLTDLHPDWREINASEDFKAWGSTQSPMVQTAISKSNDHAELSLILSLYKQTKGKSSDKPTANAEKRQAQIDSAATPKSGGTPPPVNTAGEATDDQAIWDGLREDEKRQEARNR